jgi:hypothetical protein
MAIGCSRLETVARDLFNQFSWRPVFRVTCWLHISRIS